MKIIFVSYKNVSISEEKNKKESTKCLQDFLFVWLLAIYNVQCQYLVRTTDLNDIVHTLDHIYLAIRSRSYPF